MEQNERFVWFTDSKNMRSGYCFIPHQGWRMLPENPEPYRLAVAIQEELRNLDLECNNLNAEDLIKNVLRNLNGEF